MERKPDIPDVNIRAGVVDRTTASTERAFKCSKCGNTIDLDTGMNEATCDVCGHQCTMQTCQVLWVSEEGF